MQTDSLKVAIYAKTKRGLHNTKRMHKKLQNIDLCIQIVVALW